MPSFQDWNSLTFQIVDETQLAQITVPYEANLFGSFTHMSMAECKKNVTPLLTHGICVFFH